MTKVLAICGSLRKASVNRALIRSLPALAPEGMEIVEAPSIDLPLYNFDIQAAGFPDTITALADAVRGAAGVIIVTPEYNYSVPAPLKNAIDWLSRVPNQPFQNKPITLMSAAPGILGGARAQYHLRQIFIFLEGMIVNRPEVMVTMAGTKFEMVDNAPTVLNDQPTKDVIKQNLAALARLIARLG
ncbi:MAG: NAD(P)H-dependent oxidoreductase [Alphaproteobacteria bacterium]|nr:NAD(P)H-dependent oxidoreductase [Alphaproteobacteria bacterium]